MIILKSSNEIQKIRESGKIVSEALNLAGEAVKPGMTTWELNELIEKVIVGHKARPSFKNYNGFPAASCISPNCIVVHGIPSKKVILQEGDIVSVDVGAFLNGYHADAARTFPVGEISREARTLIDVTKECFMRGAAQAVAGNRIGDIGFAVQSYAEENGYGVVRELIGHGVGRNLHEDPDVPNFGNKGRGQRLANGMVIAIEPMINAGTAAVDFDKEDGWTVRTRDRKLSAHYENTVAITPDGPVFLTV
ncbi:MAG: type I methionyl aminopeptidase [Ruminococcaceae bacterium]|nr:type I methionyl aminopeptidase [Oscillospiraceae bacterium]